MSVRFSHGAASVSGLPLYVQSEGALVLQAFTAARRICCSFFQHRNVWVGVLPEIEKVFEQTIQAYNVAVFEF